ncbi:MAG: YbjN domain-containing protein [Propionibacteriaceae bacterium]
MSGDSEVRRSAIGAVQEALGGLELEWSETTPGVFAVTLPGTAKLKTECALEIGRYGMSVRAFVARRPDENHAATYRWLLERNLRLNGIAFSVDTLGDIHLTGRFPNAAVTSALVDQVLGAVAETADSSFNPILELGFAESIRREWAWRRSRGEPTANLAAFAHLDPGEADQD